MPNIEKMYEYSLSSYLGVFETALQEAKPDRIIDNRLKNLREKLTQSMYDYTCLGTFEVLSNESEIDLALSNLNPENGAKSRTFFSTPQLLFVIHDLIAKSGL